MKLIYKVFSFEFIATINNYNLKLKNNFPFYNSLTLHWQSPVVRLGSGVKLPTGSHCNPPVQRKIKEISSVLSESCKNVACKSIGVCQIHSLIQTIHLI